MFGVLLVDDEVIVRLGIKSMIDWERLGLTVIADTSNGQEAMEVFKKFNPEIVITDIKMPIMDGIEFIKNIRTINSETKIIILTCLQDFEYAKEAISLGASEYFVKSDMMPADMERILIKVRDSIVIEQDKQIKLSEMRIKALKSKIVEKEQFLWELSMNAVSWNEATKSIIQQMDLNYLMNGYFVFNVSVDYYEKVTAGMLEQEKIKLFEKVHNIVESTVNGEVSCKGEVYNGNSGEVNLILKVMDYASELNKFEILNSIGEKIIKAIKTELKYSITIGISDTVNNLENLNRGYTQAKNASNFKVFNGCGKIISYANTISPNVIDRQISLDFKKIRDYIYLLKRSETNILIEDIFNQIAELRDYEALNTLPLELVVSLISIYSEICKDVDIINNKKKAFYEQIKYLETIEDIIEWFKLVFNEAIDMVMDIYNSDKNSVSKARSYIEENFAREISLQTISNHVHLSKNYFVNLFKKEMNESFVDYLTKVRIKKAKSLLENSELKINDIGIRVGIEDPRYFSKVFKKSTGYTPKEYRKRAYSMK